VLTYFEKWKISFPYLRKNLNSIKTRVLHIVPSFPNATQIWLTNLLNANTKNKLYLYAEVLGDSTSLHSNITIVKTPYTKPSNKFSVKLYYLKSIRFISRFIRENKISHVHAHFANMGYLYLGLKTKEITYVVSFYGYDYETLVYRNKKWGKAFNKLFFKADLFLCEGAYGLSVLNKLGCNKDKLRIQKLGVPKENIQYVKRNKKANSLKLIQIASFTEKKGHIYSVKAIENCIEEYPNLTLDIYGNIRNEKYYQHVLAYIMEHKLSNFINIHTYLQYDNISEKLSAFDVFIHPSCYGKNRDCEGGAPTILLDAQATGMPVLSTNHCDIPSSVIVNKTALLSKEKDVVQLSENIITFYKMSQKEYDNYTVNAFNHILNNFDIEQNASSLSYV